MDKKNKFEELNLYINIFQHIYCHRFFLFSFK